MSGRGAASAAVSEEQVPTWFYSVAAKREGDVTHAEVMAEELDEAGQGWPATKAGRREALPDSPGWQVVGRRQLPLSPRSDLWVPNEGYKLLTPLSVILQSTDPLVWAAVLRWVGQGARMD